MIHFRIIETIKDVDSAWARGCQADADFIGEFGMGCRHECRHLLMPDLHKLKEVQVPLQASENAVDAIARVAKNTLYPPLRQSFQHKIANFIAHDYCNLSLCEDARERHLCYLFGTTFCPRRLRRVPCCL